MKENFQFLTFPHFIENSINFFEKLPIKISFIIKMETICSEVKNVEETTEHDAHCFDISVFPESSCLETVITGREMLSSPPPHPLSHTRTHARHTRTR